MSKEIETQYKKLGIKVLTDTKVESIKEDGSQVTVAVSKDGKNGEVTADKVLQAIGIDEYMRTNVPHIYAVGDVTGLLQLAHVAAAQGVVAAGTIGGSKTLPLGNYRMMPRASSASPRWPASA